MTTNYDPTEEVIGGSTDVYVAPVGTSFPTTLSGSLSAWTHLGLTTEDGVRPGLKRATFSVRSSQRFYEGRIGVQSISALVEFDLQQWNSDTLILALGGGEVVSVGGGEFKYEPPDPSVIDERALLLHTTDGDAEWMWGWTRVMNSKDFATSLSRTKEATLPIGMSLLDPGSDLPHFILGNSAALVAES